MTESPDNMPPEEDLEVISGILARGMQILAMFVTMGLVLFLGAGIIHWVWAWVFLGIGLVSVSINAVFMLRLSPETVAERGKPKEVQTWDKWILGGWLLSQYILLPLAAGLDYRFSSTGEITFLWHITGALVYALTLGLTGWARSAMHTSPLRYASSLIEGSRYA